MQGTDFSYTNPAHRNSLLRSLADIHAAGVTHGDLDPGNLKVKADGSVVLLDFGASLVDQRGHLIRQGHDYIHVICA